MRAALARVPDTVVVHHDADGRIIEVANPGLIGRSEDELVGKNLSTGLGQVVSWDVVGSPQSRTIEWEDTHTGATFSVDLVPLEEGGGFALVREPTARVHDRLGRAVFDSALDAILVVDSEQRYVDVNPAASRMLGYSREQFLSMTIGDLLVPGTERLWGEFVEAGQLAGQMDLLCADGSLLTVDYRSKANVAPDRHVSVIRDATQRLENETRLRRAQALLEDVFDVAPVGLALVEAAADGTRRVLRINQAFSRLVGASLDMLPSAPADLVHPDDRDLVSPAWERSGSDPLHAEIRVRRQDGEYFWAGLSASGWRESDDGPRYMIAALVDLTERHLAEAALRESESRSRVMVEAANEGVWRLDAEHRIAFSNRRLAEMLGADQDELLGASAAQLVAPEDLPDLYALLEAVARGRRDRRELRLMQRPGDRRLPVIVSASPLALEEGRFAGSLATVTDIAVLVDAERRRAELRQELHARQRLDALGRLAGGIAHEFNNLLGIITGFASFLDDDLADQPDRREDVREIKTAAERAAELTHQLLTFGRREVAAPEVLDLGKVIEESQSVLRSALDTGVRLAVDLPAGPSLVRMDRRQAEQVLLNLVLNANEAMAGGGLVTIELAPPAPAGDLLIELRVRDEGLGMTADVAARAFEPFFSTKGPEYSGLGLASVFGIVTDSGGRVEIDSEEGGGTAIVITLPVAEAPAAGAALEPAPIAARVLVVDDEPAVRTLTTRLLRRGGCEVVSCEDASEALALLESEKQPFDVLLTDLVLPGMSGGQLASRVLERRPELGVVFMSGYTAEVASREAVRDAEIPFVAKPFSGEELLDGVARALRQRGRS